jgi:hypothetical protein
VRLRLILVRFGGCLRSCVMVRTGGLSVVGIYYHRCRPELQSSA